MANGTPTTAQQDREAIQQANAEQIVREFRKEVRAIAERSGLDNSAEFETGYVGALLARLVMKFPQVQEIVTEQMAIAKATCRK